MRMLSILIPLLLIAGCDPQPQAPTTTDEPAISSDQPVEPLKLKPLPQAPAAADKSSTDPEVQETLMTPPENLVRCPEVRPQMCTMEYRPVLGWLEDGSTAEYSNSCGACSDGAVVGYLPPATQLPTQ